MKTLVSLVLLSAGVAHAQRTSPSFPTDPNRGDYGRRPDFAPHIEGVYRSVQRDGTILRTLKLDRDGTGEIVTEFRSKDRDRPDRGRDDRDRWNQGRDERGRDDETRLSDRDVERFGRSAEQAAQGRSVRQTLRWTERNRRVVLRTEATRGPSRGGTDLELTRQEGGYVLDRDTALYGNERIEFRSEGGSSRRERYGRVLQGDEYRTIDRLDFAQGRDGARLTILAEGRTIEVEGRAERRGDEVVLTVDGRGRSRDGGNFRIVLRGSDVVSVHGTGTVDGRRLYFPVLFNERDRSLDRRQP